MTHKSEVNNTTVIIGTEQEVKNGSSASQGRFGPMTPQDSGPGSPSSADKDKEDDTRKRPHADANEHREVGHGEQSSPRDFLRQDRDWYEEGKYFHVWAPDRPEIHDKRFMLLSADPVEGNALLVVHLKDEESLQALHSDTKRWLRNMYLACCEAKGQAKTSEHDELSDKSYTSEVQKTLVEKLKHRLRKVQLARHDDHHPAFVEPGSIIRLWHEYNIPYKGLRIKDLGGISTGSLRELRKARVNLLLEAWDFADEYNVDVWKKQVPST